VDGAQTANSVGVSEHRALVCIQCGLNPHDFVADAWGRLRERQSGLDDKPIGRVLSHCEIDRSEGF